MMSASDLLQINDAAHAIERLRGEIEKINELAEYEESYALDSYSTNGQYREIKLSHSEFVSICNMLRANRHREIEVQQSILRSFGFSL